MPPVEDQRPVEEVSTPGQKTIEEVAAFMGESSQRTLKAVFYMADREPVFAAIRGDLEVNEIKLQNALQVLDLRLMTDDEVRAHGLVAGSASPVGIQGVRIVADDSVLASPNLIGGANKADYHLRNVNYGRDWQADSVTDISLARPGDACPRCGGPLEQKRGIEMGHIFKLGTVYSEKMGAKFLNADGQEQTAIMGCYGIGTSRMLQCIIEANHDERGIIWPASVSPYDVHLLGLGLDRDGIGEKAESLYEGLQAGGLDVLYDDRADATAGVKFNDADLLGLPVRLTISPRSLEKGSAELKMRTASEVELVPLGDAITRVKALLDE
jgi:prolyl-tRNA synthetase